MFSGLFDTNINFSYGDETDAQACGVTFQNEFWMFGGLLEKRQVNKYIFNYFLNLFLRFRKWLDAVWKDNPVWDLIS